LASTTSYPDVHRALAEVELLRGLDQQVLQRLAERVGRRSWAAGEVLFAQGMPGGSLLVLTSGAVTVYRTSPGGARAALAHLRAPASVGEVTLLDGSPRTATVEAVEDTAGLELDRAELLELLRAQPAFLDAVLRSLGGLVRRLSDQTADHILLDFAGRVAKTLAGLAGPPPGPHIVRLSQSRLAELAGGTRQSLNQVLGAFATRGWVRVEGRSVVVEDVGALRRRGGLPAVRP
jgi:CRP/FNR family cyclic AMP-dependent transcriptional regulator